MNILYSFNYFTKMVESIPESGLNQKTEHKQATKCGFIKNDLHKTLTNQEEGFSSEQQRVSLSCGPTNILATLNYLKRTSNDEGLQIPTIEQLEQECKITPKKGMTPQAYKDILQKRVYQFGFDVIMIQANDYKIIEKSIEKGLPVSILTLVQSQTNPHRIPGSVPASQHGYHFQTIKGFSKDESGNISLLWLTNPFGKEEILTKDEFEKRWGLDNTLLQENNSVVGKLSNKALKWFNITKPFTLFMLKEREMKN